MSTLDELAVGTLAQFESTGDRCFIDNADPDLLRAIIYELVDRHQYMGWFVRTRGGEELWERAKRCAAGEYELDPSPHRGPDLIAFVDGMGWPQSNLYRDGCKHDVPMEEYGKVRQGGSCRCSKCGTLLIGIVIVGDEEQVRG